PRSIDETLQPVQVPVDDDRDRRRSRSCPRWQRLLDARRIRATIPLSAAGCIVPRGRKPRGGSSNRGARRVFGVQRAPLGAPSCCPLFLVLVRYLGSIIPVASC